MSIEQLGEAVLACRAAAQTDSLAVALDLTLVEPAAEAALFEVLGLARARDGEMPSRSLANFHQSCAVRFNALLKTDPASAIQLATMVGVFAHECRHIHDLRLTRTGAELLLMELRAYNDTPQLLKALRNWQARNPERKIRYPLTSKELADMELPADIVDGWRAALAHRNSASGLWAKRSAFRAFPGTSIRDLFEMLGFVVQMDVILCLFGEQAASMVSTSMTTAVQHDYLRPAHQLFTLCQARGKPLPAPLDLSSLALDALTVTSISESFKSDGKTTGRHPGAWFDRFAEVYCTVPPDLHPNPLARPMQTVDCVLKREGKPDALYLIQETSDWLDAEMLRIGPELVASTNRGAGAAVLMLTEIPIDFRTMQRAVRQHQQYHTPVGYLELLLTGALLSVYVAVNTRHGRFDFRTPSDTPANHIGASRIAMESAKQTRRLAAGLAGDADFLDEAMLELMLAQPPDGMGLRLRLKVE